jgi:hypothetical protein
MPYTLWKRRAAADAAGACTLLSSRNTISMRGRRPADQEAGMEQQTMARVKAAAAAAADITSELL